ncbi:MAG: methylthioribulose 1-phosphate dehydratase [Deltaproteobacteria bacterium]|nr:methylthioribulose 1-phosphate dehydratase [Deltaproteobacteria bacterium]
MSELRAEPVKNADDARRVIVALCKRLYEQGWVSGTGGGISIRVDDKVYMAPSGLQKEMIQPEWIFELDLDGEVISGPPAELGFTVSQCRPLFLEAMRQRKAGAVIHSHSRNAVVAAAIAERAQHSHIRITRLEMLKGLRGVGFDDVHEVPVIDNTAHECDLADSLREAIEKNPKVHAVVVKRHGLYVWGDDWLAAKRHAECYDELFAQVIEFARLQIPLA